MHTEVHFFLSGGYTNMSVINPPEKKLASQLSGVGADYAQHNTTCPSPRFENRTTALSVSSPVARHSDR